MNTLVIIGEVFGMHHQLGGSTEDDMNKMSVIGHISHLFIFKVAGGTRVQAVIDITRKYGIAKIFFFVRPQIAPPFVSPSRSSSRSHHNTMELKTRPPLKDI